VTCQNCKGTRFNQDTLAITYKGKNISDVLDMRIEDAVGFFANFPAIIRILKTLMDVGLGYMAVGSGIDDSVRW